MISIDYDFENPDSIPINICMTIILKSQEKFYHKKLKDVDVTPAELPVLIQLYTHSGCTQRSIVKSLYITESNVAKLLKRLEKKNIVERKVDPNKKNRNLVFLTEYGYEITGNLLDISSNWEEDITEDFSEETLKMIEKAKSSEPDLNLGKVTKQEKDILFLNSTEKALSIHDEIIDNLPTSNGNYAWLYNNKIIFYKIIGNNIPDYILIDIIKLMLSNYNYNKAARFIKLKYGLNRNYAIEVYVTAETIKHNSVEIKSLKRKYDYYKIDTHASPCPICKKKVGEIHRFSEAIIGETYPPFCRHNCSNALPLIK